jgi:FkbM family methyltransferase
MKHIIQNLATEGGIDMLDLGSGGGLDSKWAGLSSLCNLVGFDPNEQECRRMEQAPHGLRSARYLPHAVGDRNGEQTLYLTRSPWCSSLLPPRRDWLDRLEFHGLFEVVGTEKVNVVTLAAVEEVQARDFDVVKVDVQGMELPILRNCGRLLDQAFAVETETGFVQNYEGETTFGEIDLFMRAQGFRLFDLTTHRQPRRNPLGRSFRSTQQLIVAEAIWLKDYIQLARAGAPQDLTRRKCLAALAICATLRTYDYGFELAQYFCEVGALRKEDCVGLERTGSWILPSNRWRQLGGDGLIAGLMLFPASIRKLVLEAARSASDRKSWVTRLRQKKNGANSA